MARTHAPSKSTSPPGNLISADEADRIFGANLQSNYGHAGPMFVHWILAARK